MVQAVQSQGNFESKSNTSENKLIEEIRKLKREGARVQFENNALRAMVAGEFDQSVANFTEAINRGDPTPETYKLYADRAAAHMQRNDYAAAYKDFGEAISRTEAFVKETEGQINTTTGKPVDTSWAAGLLAYYYNERGMASVFGRRYKDALPDFDKALSLRPKTAKTLKDKSRALVHLLAADPTHHLVNSMTSVPGCFNDTTMPCQGCTDKDSTCSTDKLDWSSVED